MQDFNGLGTGMDNLWRLSRAQSRSISPENFSGAKGQGGRAIGRLRRQACGRAWPGLEDQPLRGDRARRGIHAG